jgi:cellulose biosynthesis protein BcsQ
MVATLERSPARKRAAQREIVVAIAHQKGGVGKSTSAALLAGEISWLRPTWTVLIEDRDPDRNLTARWPGDTDQVRLVEPGEGVGNLRIVDTGPAHADQLDQILYRCDYVVIPVRLEPMTTQALGLMLPRLQAVQQANGGAPGLAGLILTDFVGRVAEHVEVRRELEAFAAELGTSILGVVPFSATIGMRLSMKGHLYRPAATRLLEVIDGRA